MFWFFQQDLEIFFTFQKLLIGHPVKMSISSPFVYFSDFEVFLFFATFLVLGNLFLGKTEKQYVP